MFRPKSVNIFSNVYSIEYVEKQKDVDGDDECRPLSGQIYFPTQTIRIFDNGQIGEAEIVSTILEEILHGIEADLRIKIRHDDLGRFAKGLADVFVRNGWLREEI